jgi:hypothetical protein
MLEDIIDLLVLTPTIPPSFNDSFVVTMDGEVSVTLVSATEEADKTLEANSFCPSDVSFSAEHLPTGYESPGSPAAVDDNGNTHSRTCIRECPTVEQFSRSGMPRPRNGHCRTETHHPRSLAIPLTGE